MNDPQRNDFERDARLLGFDLTRSSMDGDRYASESTHGAWRMALRIHDKCRAQAGEPVAWALTDCLGDECNSAPTTSKKLRDEWVRLGMLVTPLYTHPATSADRVAELEAQLAESRERVARAYGLLWHVNAGIDAPWGTPSLTPERAAMESRKVLRDMLTSEQRGDGINAARDLMKALAADQEKNDE